MEERLEPRPEAAPRASRALRDRAQAAVGGRVEMKDPIGLAVADRAQHDRLGLQRPGQLELQAILCEVMKPVKLYTTDQLLQCAGAKMLLGRRGIAYEEINLSRDPDSREKLVELTGMFTFPQIVIGDEPLGGFDQLLAADRAGRLAELLAA